MARARSADISAITRWWTIGCWFRDSSTDDRRFWYAIPAMPRERRPTSCCWTGLPAASSASAIFVTRATPSTAPRSLLQPRLRLGIQRKQLLRVRDTAQRIAADRNQAALDVADIGERRRHQNGLIERTAHRRDPACLVDGRADDGEVQAFAAADIAIEELADMQTEIHVGDRLAGCRPPFFQFGDTFPRVDRGG